MSSKEKRKTTGRKRREEITNCINVGKIPQFCETPFPPLLISADSIPEYIRSAEYCPTTRPPFSVARKQSSYHRPATWRLDFQVKSFCKTGNPENINFEEEKNGVVKAECKEMLLCLPPGSRSSTAFLQHSGDPIPLSYSCSVEVWVAFQMPWPGGALRVLSRGVAPGSEATDYILESPTNHCSVTISIY